jgi:hypothetical protein
LPSGIGRTFPLWATAAQYGLLPNRKDVTAAGTVGAALPRIAAALEKSRPITIQHLSIDARDKTARELFDQIEAEAERRGAAGAVTFTVRTG